MEKKKKLIDDPLKTCPNFIRHLLLKTENEPPSPQFMFYFVVINHIASTLSFLRPVMMDLALTLLGLFILRFLRPTFHNSTVFVFFFFFFFFFCCSFQFISPGRIVCTAILIFLVLFSLPSPCCLLYHPGLIKQSFAPLWLSLILLSLFWFSFSFLYRSSSGICYISSSFFYFVFK